MMDSPASTFNPNKHLKEQFVSNLKRTSMMELFLLITTLSMILFLRSVYSSTKKGPNSAEALSKKDDNINAVISKKNMGSYLAAVTLDVLYIVFPVILCLTILADWTYTNAVVMTSLVAFFILARRSGFSVSQEEGVRSLRTNISAYRVAMNFLTCVCILAVDFKIFPRRYAKTETYGTGLMDIGVGSFIVANALVSRQARGIAKTNLRNAISSTCPLIVLGFARVFFTSSVDYQVHVGEYGVHWNFFFTLAAVAILTSMINLPPSYCGILGWFILLVYEVFLLLGLNEYLLSNERGHDIISQNKEGIYSIFGYWGLYLVCVQLGNYLFFGSPGDAVLRTNDWARIRVWIICLLFWLLTVFLDRHVERVSRRMCNLAYVTVTLAMNLQVFAVLTLADYVPGYKVASLIEVFDRNLLGSFLLANVLTGMVNLSMDTLSVSPFTALAILVGYAYILSIAAAVAHFYGIRLKFW
ncbi:uncharacterized protein At4g17910 isoform X2 [Lycium barbarum]|uniref:uncharacterized protein At4g17910 isoform X2 n=1 Tax=Lycium barbarum TaxID=112863 RepID=UPI00293E7E33|nr:uncharacterized protein At4g17910 isoform X2 [Lycium barbarum]